MNEIITRALDKLGAQFQRTDAVALDNQRKVLDAFIANRVALRHFAPTTGYGYDDCARDRKSVG